MKRKLLYLLSSIVLLSACKQGSTREDRPLPSHPGPIKIAGAYALLPLTKVFIAEFQKTHPYAKFEVEGIGSGRGLNELAGNKIDLAMISSDITATSDSLLWMIPVARLGVVPVISAKNPYLKEIMKKGIRKDELAELFSGQTPKFWGDLFGKAGQDKVNIYLRSDSSGATDVLGRYLWLQSNEMKGSPVDGEEKMNDAISKDPFALGYCNFIYAIEAASNQFKPDMMILPIDLNNNGKLDIKENFYDSVPHLQRAMWMGRFPCVLTRTLYFGANGKPATKEVVEFLIWVLTDGQKLVANQGYIELHSFEIPPRLYALKN
jgi:phosphate transport system substrate-binding protein